MAGPSTYPSSSKKIARASCLDRKSVSPGSQHPGQARAGRAQRARVGATALVWFADAMKCTKR